jgi:hypothetical protein
MPHPRIHNALFALFVGCCLGATAWSVAAREPGGFAMPASPVATKPASKDATPAPAAAATSEQAVPKNITEQQIREGKLSKRPARYQAKVTP